MDLNTQTTHNKTVEKLQEGVIYNTTNYGIFKGILGNRPLYQPHVNRLIVSIEKKNMLSSNPVKVNEQMQVIDGQHRLMAAKALKTPVYYQLVSDSGLREVQLLQTTRAWSTQDFLDSFIAMGKNDYKTLQDFADEHRLSISISMLILSQRYTDHRALLRDFKNGDFHVADYTRAEDMAGLISEIRRHSPDLAWVDRDCIRALALLQAQIDPKELTDQLNRYQQVVTRRQSMKDYLGEFENLMNANRVGKQIKLI